MGNPRGKAGWEWPLPLLQGAIEKERCPDREGDVPTGISPTLRSHKTPYTAMAPTPTFLLLAFVFWTYPAAAAVIVYRMHDSSLENVRDAYKLFFNDVSEALSLEALSIELPSIDSPTVQPQPEA